MSNSHRRAAGRPACAHKPLFAVARRRVYPAPPRDQSQARARQRAIRFGPHAGQNRRPELGVVRGNQGRWRSPAWSPTGRASPNAASLTSWTLPSSRHTLPGRLWRVASPRRSPPIASSSQGIGCFGLISGPGSRRSETPLFWAENSLLRADRPPVNLEKIPVMGLTEITDKLRIRAINRGRTLLKAQRIGQDRC
jgi:hypothetical protein